MCQEMFVSAKEIKRELQWEDAANETWSQEFFRNNIKNQRESDDVVDTKIDVVDMVYEKALFKCDNCEYRSEFYSSFVIHANTCNESLNLMSDVKVFKSHDLLNDEKQFISDDLMGDVKDHKSFYSENGSFNQKYDICDIKDEIVIEDMMYEKVYYKCSSCDFGTGSYCAYQAHISACFMLLDPSSNPINAFECDVCKKSFDTRYHLTIHHRLHRELKSDKKLKSKAHDKMPESNYRHKMHMQKQFRCTICSKTFRYENYLARHIIKHSMEKQFGCHICQKKFKWKANLKWHIRTYHGKYMFDKCYEKFVSKKNHIENYSTRICQVCQNSFKYTTTRKSRSSHAEKEPFVCTLCQRKDSKVNIKTIRDKIQHECKICHKTYTTNSNLNVHMKVVHDKIRYKCELCHKTFAQKKSLKPHIQFKHYNITYECEVCLKIMRSKQSLDRHVKEIHNEDRSECKFCPKSFIHEGSLNIHLRSAHGKIKYECEICHKTFNNRQSLHYHVQSIHNNIKYKCEVCHKTFRAKGNLSHHVKTIHDKIGSECKFCLKTFIHEGALNTHLRLAHGKIKYECEICHKTFNNRQSLHNHIIICIYL